MKRLYEALETAVLQMNYIFKGCSILETIEKKLFSTAYKLYLSRHEVFVCSKSKEEKVRSSFLLFLTYQKKRTNENEKHVSRIVQRILNKSFSLDPE